MIFYTLMAGKGSETWRRGIKLQLNLIFAVKYNRRHKVRLVADGSLTLDPVENIYSGVVSLRHLSLAIFLGELNNLELWVADIGNAYLEAYTNEKLFILQGLSLKNLKASFISSTRH